MPSHTVTNIFSLLLTQSAALASGMTSAGDLPILAWLAMIIFADIMNSAAGTPLQLCDLVELHQVLIWYGIGMTDMGFEDVDPKAWYAGAVTWAAEQEIARGASGTAFSPDADCVRGQIVSFLYRLFV